MLLMAERAKIGVLGTILSQVVLRGLAVVVGDARVACKPNALPQVADGDDAILEPLEGAGRVDGREECERGRSSVTSVAVLVR